MPIVLGVAIAGAIGTLARYQLDGFISSRINGIFPWGTFAINTSGAFILGLLFTIFTERFSVQPWLRSSLMIGFLGAYTTFSTLMLETAQLLQEGAYSTALLNSFGSLAIGMTAVIAGIYIGRLV